MNVRGMIQENLERNLSIMIDQRVAELERAGIDKSEMYLRYDKDRSVLFALGVAVCDFRIKTEGTIITVSSDPIK